MKKVVLSSVLFTFLIYSSAFSQRVEQERVTRIRDWARVQPRKLIDCPTAGLLPRGSFDFDIKVFPEGGLVNTIDVGLMNRFMLGLSFGGAKLISDEKPDWYPRVEIAAKLRFINESYLMPAFVLGYDGQGIGAYSDSLERYQYKSKGFYGVVSKNYLVFDIPVGFHFGGNYSLENEDEDKNISLFLGADVRFNESFGGILEYDLGTNDDGGRALGEGKGYLNLGLQWIFSDQLTLQLDLRNLFTNTEDKSYIGRELRIIFVEFF